MFHLLKQECGANRVNQNHDNLLPSKSIEMFTQIANNRDLLELPPKNGIQVVKTTKVKRVENAYILGIKKLKKLLVTSNTKFKQNLVSLSTGNAEAKGEELDEPMCEM